MAGLKRTLTIFLITLGIYALSGFLILPGIVQRIANQQLNQYTTVPAQLQRVQLNPFTLEVTLWGLHIGKPGQEQLSFERLYANLEIDSLWRRTLHLANIELDKARGEILFASDGTLNLTQLFQLPDSTEETVDEPQDEPPFPVRIDRLRLNEMAVHFLDQRPSEPVEFGYDSLNLELSNLSTVAHDDAEMTLSATGPYGARIDWQGHVSLAPFTSTGQLKVTDAVLATFWPYVQDIVPIALKSGKVNFSTRYALDLTRNTELRLTDARLNLAPFAIETLSQEPLLSLEQLSVSDARFDLSQQKITIGKIQGQTLDAWASREADGELNWLKLLNDQVSDSNAETAAAPASTAEPVAETTAETTVNDEPDTPWQILLQDVQLRDYRVHLQDRVPKQAVELEIGPLDLDMQTFDSLGDTPFAVQMNSGIGKQGQLKAEGRIQLDPVAVTLQLATQNIDLRPAQAYLEPFVHLELRNGLLDSDLHVQLTDVEPLAFSIDGNLQVNQLHTVDSLKKRDFVRWKQLRLNKLHYQHDQVLTIDRIELDQPYARFVINADLTTNVGDLVVQQENAQPADSSGKPLAIQIGGITINDGSANFADFSLRPYFATGIEQLNGKIGALDSRHSTPATVDIKGQVDRYAPVSIQGSLNPFNPLDSLDIATHFKQVELTTLTPYSGKFAGYRIQKGRLDLDLQYQISQGQLNAQNKVVIDQLQLGERVDSPDAVDLPIRLAVALLKDPQGRISIELPIQGDLNNPDFSVMPIIWQTLRNLILRTAQAPFKFIGGLIGSSDVDLSTIPFSPGSDTLDNQAHQTLDTLAKALKERPALRLEITGTAAASQDGSLLAEKRLEYQYQDTWYKILQRRGDKVLATARELSVHERDKPALLEGIYRDTLRQQPPAEWTQLDKEQRYLNMREAVLDFWANNDILLRRLAQKRATQIKNYLVDHGQLSAERIYLLDVNLINTQSNQIPTNLTLDSE